MLGYEPVDLTVHPPPITAEGGFIFFRICVLCSHKNVLKGKPDYFGVIQAKRPKTYFLAYTQTEL